MTLSTAMGCGTQKGSSEGVVNEIKGLKTKINLLPKIKVEVVVDDKDVETVIMSIREVCATDHVGDGKIFVRSIDDAIRGSQYAQRKGFYEKWEKESKLIKLNA
jgi:nitrogen regulatory protein P-II 1